MQKARSLHAKPVLSSRSSARPLARRPPRGIENFPIVGIGASAGGLDACRKLVDALPANNGMAFILVQHLDPTHESMMVDLLTGHTSMTVRQAADGMTSSPTISTSFPQATTSLSVSASCTFRSRQRATVRGCHSIFCCTRWRRTAVRAPSAWSSQEPARTGASG